METNANTPHRQTLADLIPTTQRTLAQSIMKGKIRVISERIMTRGYEPTVARLMETVKTKVRAQPGLLSVATYNQIDDKHKYVVFSEWRSKEDYDAWVNSAEFKDVERKISEVLDVPSMKTRVFRTPNEDIFLL